MGCNVKRLTDSDRAALHELYVFTSEMLREATQAGTRYGMRISERAITIGVGLAILKRLVDSDDEPTNEEL